MTVIKRKAVAQNAAIRKACGQPTRLIGLRTRKVADRDGTQRFVEVYLAV
jgi:hypothetical protein